MSRKSSKAVKAQGLETKIKPDSKKIKDMLKATGMKADKIDKEKWDTDKDMKKALLKLHGVTDEEYKRAGGTL